MSQPPWGAPPSGDPQPGSQPSAHRPPPNQPSPDESPGRVTAANANPEPPSLLNRQTNLPWSQLKQILHPGEMPWLIVGLVIGVIGYVSIVVFVVLTIISIATGQGFLLGPSENDGVSFLIYQQISGFLASLFLAPLLIYFARALGYAQIRANGVRMSPTQFPEGYRMVVEAALSGGMRKIPDAYVVSGSGTINAYASGHAWRRFIVVYSDLFEVGGAARDPEALRFVIAHEVGHLAAGHTSYWRLALVTSMRSIPFLGDFLSRAQEYSADNFGYRLTGRAGAEGGIKVLAGGKYLNANVDFDEFADRALSERGLFLWATNISTTHPILIWRAQALRDRSRPGSLFLRPKGTPAGIGSLPPGSAYTEQYPTPAEAMAFIEAYPPEGEAQFGKVFPTPLPGEEGHPSGTTGYGRRMLTARWQWGQQGPGGPQGPGGYPGGPGGYPPPSGPQGPGGVGGPGGPSYPGGQPSAGYPQSQPSAGYPQSQPSASYGQPYPQSQPSASYGQAYPQSQPSAGYPQSQPSASYEQSSGQQQYPQTQPSADYGQSSGEQQYGDQSYGQQYGDQQYGDQPYGQQQYDEQQGYGTGSSWPTDDRPAEETRLVPRVTDEQPSGQDASSGEQPADERPSWGEQPTAVQPAVPAWGDQPTTEQPAVSDDRPSSGATADGEPTDGSGRPGDDQDPWHRDRDPWHRQDPPDQRG